MCGTRVHRLRHGLGLVIALALSVALHVAVGVLLPSRRAVPPPSWEVVWFDVEMRPAPAPQPPPAIPSAPRERAPLASSAASQRSGGSRHATGPAPQPTPTGEAAPADAARRNKAEGLESPPGDGALDLRPRLSTVPLRSDELRLAFCPRCRARFGVCRACDRSRASCPPRTGASSSPSVVLAAASPCLRGRS
jgi:hypothetical protein